MNDARGNSQRCTMQGNGKVDVNKESNAHGGERNAEEMTQGLQ